MKVKPKEFAVKVEGIPLSRLKKYDNIIEIRGYGKVKRQSNVTNTIKYEKTKIEAYYPDKKLNPLVEDLINVALATFCVDSMVQRTVNKSRFFTRDIRITVPVSDKEKWNDVKPILEQTISFMTYDIFKYNFIKRKCKKITNKLNKSASDSITLFSGGLDSFVGSHFLISKGHKPIFLSVNHSGIGKVVSELHKTLPKEYQKIVLGVKKKVKRVEYTQFSRSFLYLSLAVAIAKAHNNINKIFIPENGIIAFQIGLKEGRYGTRTAHPKYINYFSSLIEKLFPSWNIEIKNPFIYKTKGEVVKLLGSKENYIKETVSCAHIGRWFKDSPQCGMCIPCIIRRISLISNEIYLDKKVSEKGKEAFEIDFDNPSIERNIRNVSCESKMFYRDALVNILEILNLANNIKRCSDNELIIKYPEMMSQKVLDMYKRFGSEVMKTISHFKAKNPSLNKIL